MTNCKKQMSEWEAPQFLRTLSVEADSHFSGSLFHKGEASRLKLLLHVQFGLRGQKDEPAPDDLRCQKYIWALNHQPAAVWNHLCEDLWSGGMWSLSPETITLQSLLCLTLENSIYQVLRWIKALSHAKPPKQPGQQNKVPLLAALKPGIPQLTGPKVTHPTLVLKIKTNLKTAWPYLGQKVGIEVKIRKQEWIYAT